MVKYILEILISIYFSLQYATVKNKKITNLLKIFSIKIPAII